LVVLNEVSSLAVGRKWELALHLFMLNVPL
jgi:hypothetical protein